MNFLKCLVAGGLLLLIIFVIGILALIFPSKYAYEDDICEGCHQP